MVSLDDLKTSAKNTWCPGCGNFGILMGFKRALMQLGLDRDQVVLVSGIGCHGKIVNYVNVNGFHGIHGRVLPLATGIKLANHNLTVVGFAGDADCYDEGWGHFSHAIRRNIDMTLIVHNNMVLGLTTGQTTATSQEGFKTKSTPFGSIPPALNPIAHALVSNGTFVARGYSGDMRHLVSLMVEALKHKGFAFLDVFQPCVTFNNLNTYDWFRKRVYKLEEEGHDYADIETALERSFEWGDRIPIGIFYRAERPTFRGSLPQLKEATLRELPTEDIDITSILRTMM
ncbi:MAG: thiamine pyrophosphate-dependent enzyme [Candidatus Bathyarchaeota archaeon]|nr:thiamine pyrophosphate-dependent enzyme [Candidatus Bathyarchaeota archaeon]MDH5779919.1 thiamine pyrophosphate-dependent enzyme [Candidatus Bathyarchaeota archaeon]